MTWEILRGDCRDLMRGVSVTHAVPYHHVTHHVIPDKSIHCVVTSPPYWALRDYGVNGQLGLEATPEDFVANMVGVFREVWRVLRDDGVCFVNLGDSYAAGGNGGFGKQSAGSKIGRRIAPPGLQPLDLVGAPWRVALALQADGWILRRDIVWSKPNPMPESVNGWRWERCRMKTEVGFRDGKTKQAAGGNPRYDGFNERYHGKEAPAKYVDCPGCPKCEPKGGYVLRKGSGRCSTAHEYIFQLVKTGNYYYDCEAVKEQTGNNTHSRGTKLDPPMEHAGIGHIGWTRGTAALVPYRNKRSVWEIATQPYAEAHFATYPDALVEPCIKAATSQKGCCPECGSPWARILEDSEEAKSRMGAAWHDHKDDLGRGQRGAPPALKGPAKVTRGWWPTCGCDAGEPVPCTVYDPFTGSGTTGAVAVRHGRRFIGHELNPEYIDLANKRIRESAEKAGTLTAGDTADATTKPDKPTQLGLL